ncbi:tRNA pseudouridine(38-40) synthase TruA [Dissulfurirhabdus thermomarina]|uniref:tRNA pseudouridine synthase A n=1 Tax=Dissulfurirhabdus thermomarina TaxID=1765737 RepID=A0A6N9TQL9_DISTH|nr:tRNA pseudouridine(38-40) synthase TruA [Dissulfurirhabdus thermomarina]NDY42014.1 tRNA pseudouridine(38-40) synthase TruA [Dissulfurirhabdus thermomarina]NMX24001.1 tRNA pseudouridine(38-40) synthase TruA [Dissulfurirhabdus thermomarina]
MVRRRLKLVLSYHGAAFHGWQRQAAGRPTVQAALEAALSRMTGERSTVVGAGRTDAGVHAAGQVAHFETRAAIPCDGFREGLNSLLPASVAVLGVEEAAPDFHARYDAVAKTYSYRVLVAPSKAPLWEDRAWRLPSPLDIEAMRQAAAALLGRHDFAAFQASGSSVKTTVRTLYRCRIEVLEPGALAVPAPGPIVHFSVAADGFLRYMVRNMVGTLVEVGSGRRPPDDLQRILSGGDRRLAGRTAPAEGLCLDRVHYHGPPPRHDTLED